MGMFSGALKGLTAVGLSADAFAASVARGASAQHASLKFALGNGAIFGFAEGAMCLTGWLLAANVSYLISTLDHWVAFILLSSIGGKMIVDSFSQSDDPEPKTAVNAQWGMTSLTALGTSVDSAVIGVAMNFSGVHAKVALLIGAVSGTLSTLDFLVGPITGQLLGKRAELLGGLVLVIIGVWIWCEHMLI